MTFEAETFLKITELDPGRRIKTATGILSWFPSGIQIDRVSVLQNHTFQADLAR
jgi:hypothetical protein